MATKTRLLGPGSFTITGKDNGKDFSADLTKAQINPSNSSDDPTNYLDGSQETNTSTTWTFEGTISDDFSEAGLAAWCFDNANKTLPFEFIPNKTGGIKWTGNVTITPVAMGGDVKTKNTNDFSFPVTDLAHAPNTPATPTTPGA